METGSPIKIPPSSLISLETPPNAGAGTAAPALSTSTPHFRRGPPTRGRDRASVAHQIGLGTMPRHRKHRWTFIVECIPVTRPGRLLAVSPPPCPPQRHPDILGTPLWSSLCHSTHLRSSHKVSPFLTGCEGMCNDRGDPAVPGTLCRKPGGTGAPLGGDALLSV